MAWWEWLLGILLFIVALGVLIGIHELGHLGAAKLFHVYCFNYSIGFGPKLISSKRTAKHETIWTLRAIPLGGFVSMYGEGVPLDEGVFIPPSRSLEGVARWKRAIIVSAGVFLNFVLGFVLILCHNAFNQVKFDWVRPVNTFESCIVVGDCNCGDTGIKNGDLLVTKQDAITGSFVMSYGVQVNNDDTQEYAFCFLNSVSTTKQDPKLSDSIAIVPCYEYKDEEGNKGKELIEKAVSAFSDDRNYNWITSKDRITDVLAPLWASNQKSYTEKDYQDKVNEYKTKSKDELITEYRTELFKSYTYDKSKETEQKNLKVLDGSNVYQPTSEVTAEINVNFSYYHEDKKMENNEITLKNSIDKSKWDDVGITFKRDIYHYSASELFSTSWKEWCNADVAVIRGLGALFTGTGEVGGIIKIAQISSQTLSSFGFERYLYLWGMISCNLAILNLLPFPGLDGWTLLVTAYEGVRKKQMSTKVKNVVSLIGLALLFGFMFFIIIKDIVGLIV